MCDGYIMHVGVKRRSGRYPWGSGKHPYQDEPWFKGWKEMREQGMKDSEIAKHYGMTMNELKYKYSYAKDAQRAYKIAQVKHMRFDKQMSTKAIAEKMGTSEVNIKSWLEPSYEKRVAETRQIMDGLEKVVDKKKVIDVGSGVAQVLGVNPTKLESALTNITSDGYNVVTIKVPYAQNPKQNPRTYKILCSPDIGDGSEKAAKRYCYEHLEEIDLPYDLKYKDAGEGKTAANIFYPMSIDSKRLMVKYADVTYDDGFTGADRDGLIQLRRGVKDISMGDNLYAQVRIAIDDTHYLKGMAVYSDNMPEGVDIIFNTNRKSTNPLKKDDSGLESVLKSMQTDPETGKIDEDNPFGAQIKAQMTTIDSKTGLERLTSAVNIVNEEGTWGDWTSSRTLASQVLSKQDSNLAKRQLNLQYAKYQKQYDDILKIENPTIRRKMLEDIAEEFDTAAVHLKAASLPRQGVSVLIPIPSLKDNEIYAPHLKDGEKVALIRYPHGGKFEIPILIVNNTNREGKSVFGNSTGGDAVGINKRTADILSGADFDGDTAVIIPNNKNYIQSQKAYAELENFDAKERYPYHEGMTVLTKQNTQREMGMITNLITDMQLQNAKDYELARAIKHSMVVIDAHKHKLDYKLSEIDNNIAELRAKYQKKEDGGRPGGASTLISRASSEDRVLDRDKLREKVDPETGKRIYYETGKAKSFYKFDDKGNKVYYHEIGEKPPKDAKYEILYPNQDHYNSDPNAKLTMKSTKMFEAEDAYSLSSGTKMESVYADYANSMKALANQARKEALSQKNIPYNRDAAEAYSKEVGELERKIELCEMRAPVDRHIDLSSNAIINQKIKDNPSMYDNKTPDGKKAIKKLRSQVIARQRAKFGQKPVLDITEKEWQAIQSGAVKVTTLSKVLRYANSDRIIELATPKESNIPKMSPSNVNLAKAMLNSGFTLAEVADALNVSASTVSRYVK